jgi:hypothetical protein
LIEPVQQADGLFALNILDFWPAKILSFLLQFDMVSSLRSKIDKAATMKNRGGFVMIEDTFLSELESSQCG